MTEEEKEAIEIIKLIINISKKNERTTAIIYVSDEETILNLIEKLQKEIEELRKLTEFQKEYINKLEQDLFENCSNFVVPKDKIRDFIKCLEKDAQNIREKKKESHDYDRSSSRIQAYLTKTNEIIKRLKELLEEE